KTHRESDIIRRTDGATTQPVVKDPPPAPAPAADTQLDTALLMMRLQLVQSSNGNRQASLPAK
ncbi:MAG: hypothetical protein FWD53_09465, partial [Phycisphaerales bacterium]|nr:hypothetical protein [Phycisphaerales bacterium]